jgi:hypothetical protein
MAGNDKKHVANLAKLTNLANLIPPRSEVLALRIPPNLLLPPLFCLICRAFDPALMSSHLDKDRRF